MHERFVNAASQRFLFNTNTFGVAMRVLPALDATTTGVEDTVGLRVLDIGVLAGKRLLDKLVRKLVGKLVCLPGGGLISSSVVAKLVGAGVLC